MVTFQGKKKKMKHKNKKNMKFSEVGGWVSMRTVRKTGKVKS